VCWATNHCTAASADLARSDATCRHVAAFALSASALTTRVSRSGAGRALGDDASVMGTGRKEMRAIGVRRHAAAGTALAQVALAMPQSNAPACTGDLPHITFAERVSAD
jgi:hypothetical protein